jgi:hypothetical protein
MPRNDSLASPPERFDLSRLPHAATSKLTTPRGIGFLSASPPAEKTTARQHQAGDVRAHEHRIDRSCRERTTALVHDATLRKLS